MKKYYRGYVLVWLLGLMLSGGCGPIVVTEEYQHFETIYVGWLDLGENKFSEFGYGSKKEWVNEIKTQNIDGIQAYTRAYMRGWHVIGAPSPSASIPWGDPNTLVITFTNIKSSMGGLQCDMSFYNGRTRKLMKRINENPPIVAFGPVWSNVSLSGRLSNAMYSMAYDIKYYLTTNEK